MHATVTKAWTLPTCKPKLYWWVGVFRPDAPKATNDHMGASRNGMTTKFY